MTDALGTNYGLMPPDNSIDQKPDLRDAAIVQNQKEVPLQTYFNKAYKDALSNHRLGDQPADDSVAKLHVPISLIAYAKSGDAHTRVGIYRDEMHFPPAC